MTSYDLIGEGDRILVAVSGGKDSYTLLDLLWQARRKAPVRYDLCAVHLDQGQPGYDGAPLRKWLERFGAPFEILSMDTYSVVRELTHDGGTFCAPCSRLRRGILYDAAARLQCNKIALGHHREDTLETLLLNLFYSGKLQVMPAVYRTDDGRFQVIRPLIECAEDDIATYAKERGYPILPCRLCARQMAAIIASGSRSQALAQVRTPTLVIHGTQDPLVPVEAGHDTAAAIPGAMLLLIEGKGHDLPRPIWPRISDSIAAHPAFARAEPFIDRCFSWLAPWTGRARAFRTCSFSLAPVQPSRSGPTRTLPGWRWCKAFGGWSPGTQRWLHVQGLDLDAPKWASSNEAACIAFWHAQEPLFQPPLLSGLIQKAIHRGAGNLLYAVKLSQHLLGLPAEERRAERLPRKLEGFLEETWQRFVRDQAKWPLLISHEASPPCADRG